MELYKDNRALVEVLVDLVVCGGSEVSYDVDSVSGDGESGSSSFILLNVCSVSVGACKSNVESSSEVAS